MKRILLLSTIFLICLLSLLTISLYALLQTRYAANIINFAFQHLTPYSVTTRQALYSPPYQLELQDVEITSKRSTLQISNVTFWLNPYVLNNGKVAFDSLLIEGANIDIRKLDTQFARSVHLNSISLNHVDISAGSWSVRELSAQIKTPVWDKPEQILPYGELQLSAQQLYSHGEALDTLLIDAEYKPEESTVYGVSFDWRGANISGQAEQYQDGWSLVNVTVNHLNLPPYIPSERLLSTLQSVSLPITHINSLDILGSSFDYAGWRFEQLDASLENLSLDKSIWQQDEAYLSFDAESATHSAIQLIAPTSKLHVTSEGIEFEDFDADFKQGRVQIDGLVSPNQVKLNSLKLSGIKWLEDTSELFESLQAASTSLQHLSIQELEISNTQMIQVERKPYWQLSGFNAKGQQLSLVREGEWGLFQGEIELSANSASWDNWLTTQALLSAKSDNGNVSLTQAFLPLENGYIEATGQWDRLSLSAPWQFSLYGDGIPLEQSWVQERLPFSLTGFAEIEAELSGLSGDYSMFAHSVSGKVIGQIHDGIVDARSADGEMRFEQTWPLEEIQIDADRGRVTVQSKSENAQLSGRLDLTKPKFGTLILNINHECQQLWSEIFDLTNVIKNVCPNEMVVSPTQ